MMNLLKVLDQIDTENFNEEQQAQFINRKKALGKLGNYAKKMTVAAIPLGALVTFTSTPARANSKQQDIKILNYALLLELLEREFYNKAVDSGVIPGGDQSAIFTRIRKDEREHVKFLKSAISSAGGTPRKKPKFDYTAGGKFDPFNSHGTGQKKAYAQLKIISQGFEDTGVRAYTGQVSRIQSKEYLTAALQIQTVEARHAAIVRALRHKNDGTKEKPWITGAGKYAPDPIKVVYQAGSEYNVSEANTKQPHTDEGIDVSQYVSKTAGTESFDEPLGMAKVTEIVTPFIPALQK